MDDVDDHDRDEIAGMLRGLACAIDDFRADSNMTNDRFWRESPVIWPFSTVEKAKHFNQDHPTNAITTPIRLAVLPRNRWPD